MPGFQQLARGTGRDISNYRHDVRPINVTGMSVPTQPAFIAAIRGYQRWRTSSLRRRDGHSRDTAARPAACDPERRFHNTEEDYHHRRCELLVKMNRILWTSRIFGCGQLTSIGWAIELAHNLLQIDWDDARCCSDGEDESHAYIPMTSPVPINVV